MPRKYACLEDRLIANTRLSDDSAYKGTACWEWIGAYVVNRGGMRYGKLDVRRKQGKFKGKRKTWYAHRLAVIVFKGRRLWPRQVVAHLCNNSLCINPEHLLGGSQRKNIQQCVRDGRHKPGTANQYGVFA